MKGTDRKMPVPHAQGTSLSISVNGARMTAVRPMTGIALRDSVAPRAHRPMIFAHIVMMFVDRLVVGHVVVL